MAANVAGTLEGKLLVLTIDTTVDLGLSKTGKSQLVASSGGFVAVGGVSYNITVIRPKRG